MLKTKTISTANATLLAVELPDGAHGIHLFNDVGRPYISYFVGVETHRRYLEQFGISEQLELLGRLPDITESQWKEIVDYFTTDEEFGKEDVFRDYLDKSFFNTAAESGLSLLQANEVLFDAGNTYIPYELGFMSATEHLERTLDVLDRKVKVWDKERTYLFTKAD